MENKFLTICSPLDSAATASAKLTHWKGYKNHQSVSLLLEAIHQFAVRYATSQYPCTPAQRYLPAMIEYFESETKLTEEQLVLEGDIEIQHVSVRVICRAWSDNSRDRLVAEAAIIVHPVSLPIKFTSPAAEDSAIPLWEILSQNTKYCEFRLNGSNPLFSEHFTGNPVCPGSLLIDLLLSTLLHPTERQTLKLKKVKFLRAVLPETIYRLTLGSAEGSQTNTFIITAEKGERHVSGSYLL
ncbi:hypothetical protein WKG86_10185 [Pantoea agglomerans]|uniref:hypothetical protein n=1 Tax=Enterobacter agglomerans TaxID=549 RepID=UPI003C7AB4FD